MVRFDDIGEERPLFTFRVVKIDASEFDHVSLVTFRLPSAF